MILRCRRCDTSFRVPDSFAGAEVPCPECGASNAVSPPEIIDAEYEITVEEDAPELSPLDPPPTEAGEGPRVVITEEETPWGTQRSYTVYMQRQMERNGLPCCSLGCLIFVILSFLLVRGCLSLF